MTLHQERVLLRPFLRWLGLRDVPAVKTLSVSEQQVPGSPQSDLEEEDTQGLPDACVFNDDGWGVFFECKVQGRVDPEQIRRHRKTAIRHGFESPHIVVIAVNESGGLFRDDTISITWKNLYRWFNGRSSQSFWAREFVQYMRIFERKMLAKDYDIPGTITMFDGLRFDTENPYTYHEGKRLIRLLGDQLQARQDLHRIGVDPGGDRRPAITGSGAEQVWDFLPLVAARNAKQFTSFPHLTVALHKSWARAAVTVPNGVKGGFRTKLAECGPEGFMQLLAELEKGLRPIIKRSQGAKPMIYVLQRHYRSQKSPAEVDAQLEADLRTAVPDIKDDVKYQPQWLGTIFEVLVHKRSNLHLGVEVRLSYNCPLVRSAKAADLFAESWKALSPLISFVLQKK
jgi:hypothetical protein